MSTTMLADVEMELLEAAERVAEDRFEQLRRRVSTLLNDHGASIGGQFVIKNEAISAFLEPMRAEILKREQRRATDAFVEVVAEQAWRRS